VITHTNFDNGIPCPLFPPVDTYSLLFRDLALVLFIKGTLNVVDPVVGDNMPSEIQRSWRICHSSSATLDSVLLLEDIFSKLNGPD